MAERKLTKCQVTCQMVFKQRLRAKIYIKMKLYYIPNCLCLEISFVLHSPSPGMLQLVNHQSHIHRSSSHFCVFLGEIILSSILNSCQPQAGTYRGIRQSLPPSTFHWLLPERERRMDLTDQMKRVYHLFIHFLVLPDSISQTLMFLGVRQRILLNRL